MDSSAAIRSSHCFMSHMQSSLQKPGLIHVQNVGCNFQSRSFVQNLAISDKHIVSHNKWNRVLVSCTKTAKEIDAAKSETSLESIAKESLVKKPLQTFPNGFEALISEVCDETEIAELKLKVGEFEMHMKRNIGLSAAPVSNISPTKPMVDSASSTPTPSPSKSSPAKTNPFVNDSNDKSPKLAALEASGNKNYVLVASTTVGSFQRGRTVKGNKLPPVCKEGDMIKDGQVIGYVDNFGTSLPVKSDVDGEVLKLLFQDGEAVGYGDALIAVLPSFHDIK
uniref:Lipoyl-binding domain-containing protein n=1 Tax=Medicago truncatula TaxID=3880 RepID=I3S1B4_MEDTR|nr:unknown [Medicago truncatula]